MRRSCGCFDRSATELTRAQAICAASSRAASVGEASVRRSSRARSRWCRRAARCAPCWWRSSDPSRGPAGRARPRTAARTRGRSGSRSARARRRSRIDAVGRDDRMGEAEPRPVVVGVFLGEQRHRHPFGHRREQRDLDARGPRRSSARAISASSTAAWAYMPVPMSVAEMPMRPGACSVPVIEARPLSACTSRS